MANIDRTHALSSVTVLAFCLCVGLPGCSGDKPEALVASAKSNLAKHDYSAGIIQLKNALQKVPNHAEARYLLGVALSESGDPAAAEIELRKAAAAGYANGVVYPAIGRALIDQGQFQKALSELATHAFPDRAATAEAQSVIGEAHLGLGQAAEARIAFVTALEAQPENESAKLGIAKVGVWNGNLPEATKLVDEVLTQSPSSIAALTFKANLLAAQNQSQEAIKTFEAVLAVDPKAVRAHIGLVPLLVKEREFDKAKAQVDALKKLAPKSPQTAYAEALLAYAQGNLIIARDAIGQVLKVAPDHTPSQLLAAAIAHDLGSYAQAEESLRKVIAAEPRSAYARRLLVSTLLRSGKSSEALDGLPPLLQQSPDEPSVLALAGEVYLANNDIAKASQYYQKVLAVDPKNAAVGTRLGQIHMTTGDTQRAIKDLESASAARSDQSNADLALVTLYLKENQFDKALGAVQVLQKKQPNNPLGWNLKGIVDLAKRDFSSARSSFEKALQLQPTYVPAARNLAFLDFQEKAPERASQRYEAILAKDPRNEDALLGLVEVARHSGAPNTEIAKIFARAVEANPSVPSARIAQIKFLVQIGDRKGALAAAVQASASAPDNVQVMELLGRTQQAAGDARQAIATFGKLASALPRAPGPLLLQADAYAAANEWESAVNALTKALQLQPDSIVAHQGMAMVQARLGRYTLALAEARAIQKQQPKDSLGYMIEAGIWDQQKKWGEAERVLSDTFRRTPSPGVALALYTALENGGKVNEARVLADRWLRDNPKDATVLLFLAERDMNKHDYASSAQRYKAVLAEHPSNLAALNNLAWVLGQAKDPEALSYAEKAYALAPNNPLIIDTLGSLLVEQGDSARGIELLTKASGLAPDTHILRLHLAQALVKSGQKTQARKQLEILANLPEESSVRQDAKKLLSTL